MNPISETLSAVRRASHVYFTLVAEQVTLSCGVALVCPRYPSYPDGNHLREVVLPPGTSLEAAYEEVQTFYAGQGLRCFRWVPAAGQAVEPIADFLTARGYRPQTLLAMRQASAVRPAGAADVRILPARAMRKALREIIMNREDVSPETRETMLNVVTDRLDHPPFDLFVAMCGDAPAGFGALLQAGEIGLAEPIFVDQRFRRRGVGLAIMAHLLALSRRLAMRTTCLATEETNLPARALYERCGFEVDGSLVQFIAPEK
ncbi:MAG: hypothetical protein AMXMBFR83_31980 [Phycisphaerae bacterium]|jgi:GNAT superfamily N-acetyltransferase